MTRSPAKLLLSTTSVYPENTTAGFEIAATLGFDGVELMVGIDPLAADIDQVEKLRDQHGVAVHSVHAPCLLVTQSTWGRDPWQKLRRSGEAAQRLGADVVVVHPPFRWQRDYARGFVDGIAELNRDFEGIDFAVENMYPWRTPGRHFQAYLPAWDPTELPYQHLTLDLSHAATARANSRSLAREWGSRLRHLHLTDGLGSMKDEHLFPGEGNQDAWGLLDDLRRAEFAGHVVLEVNSRKAGTRAGREALLSRALIEMRHHLGQQVATSTLAAFAEAQQTWDEQRQAADQPAPGSSAAD